jgi:hypothetical protein
MLRKREIWGQTWRRNKQLSGLRVVRASVVFTSLLDVKDNSFPLTFCAQHTMMLHPIHEHFALRGCKICCQAWRCRIWTVTCNASFHCLWQTRGGGYHIYLPCIPSGFCPCQAMNNPQPRPLWDACNDENEKVWLRDANQLLAGIANTFALLMLMTLVMLLH